MSGPYDKLPMVVPRAQKELSPADETKALAKLEAELLEESMDIVRGGLRGADVDEETVEKPEGWSDRDFRMAKDIRKPSGSRPGYFDLAKNTIAGIQKARQGQVSDRPLNVAVVVFTGEPPKQYDVVDVEVISADDKPEE